MKILALTLNWRQSKSTLDCVAAIGALRGHPPDLLVIDNGSGDGSAELLSDRLPAGSFISLPDNIGFAAGVNVGLRHALNREYDHVLLLNNDAFPAPDMLARLLAEAAPDIALLSPLILYENEPDRIWFAGARSHPRLLEMRGHARGLRLTPTWEVSRDVDYLLGAGLLINLDAVREVGLLDETFFLYYEDLDWSLRFGDAGWRLRTVGTARLYHRVAASSGGEDTPWRRYHIARGSAVFFRRHAGRGRPLPIALFRIGSAVRTMVRLMRQGNFPAAQAHLRGLADGLLVPLSVSTHG